VKTYASDVLAVALSQPGECLTKGTHMKKQTKKLTLSKDTIKKLEGNELRDVVGRHTLGFSDCYTMCPDCPPYW
jgi:hypothetical protein